MKSKKIFFVILAFIFSVGCTERKPPPEQMIDRCLQKQLFDECLASLPLDPRFPVLFSEDKPLSDASLHADLGKVVYNCNDAAASMSWRAPEYIELQCRNFRANIDFISVLERPRHRGTVQREIQEIREECIPADDVECIERVLSRSLPKDEEEK